MIDFVRGMVSYISPQMIVVETYGIGYQIQCSNPYLFQSNVGKEQIIYTYQHVREDILALYGFATREERALFEKLLQVSGIGPKGALAMLAAGTPGQIIAAIQAEDVDFMVKFPGVGKKTAQRVILDLKDKLDDVAGAFSEDITELTYQKPTSVQAAHQDDQSIKEAREALLALGYTEKEVDKITPEWKKRSTADWNTDTYIKAGLQLLMK